MSSKPLFAELIESQQGLAQALKAVDVAADLTLLLAHSGKTRAELARALKCSRARVTQVLSGQENLTVQTVAMYASAMGYTFDVTFRKAGSPAHVQPWQSPASQTSAQVTHIDADPKGHQPERSEKPTQPKKTHHLGGRRTTPRTVSH
jgi:transcriptional regulator with XRE-family HTH domain